MIITHMRADIRDSDATSTEHVLRPGMRVYHVSDRSSTGILINVSDRLTCTVMWSRRPADLPHVPFGGPTHMFPPDTWQREARDRELVEKLQSGELSSSDIPSFDPDVKEVKWSMNRGSCMSRVDAEVVRHSDSFYNRFDPSLDHTVYGRRRYGRRF